jgi:putative transposase
MVVTTREQRAIQILSETDSIRKLSKNNFRVLSQSQDKYYNVRKLPDAAVWLCDCKDFTFRLLKKDDRRCKHIICCEMLQETIQHEKKIEKQNIPRICPKCNSTKNVVKGGYRKLSNGLMRQKYICKPCNYTFTLHESGFASVRFSPQIITEALNLFMSGMSYRNIARHIGAVHDESVSYVTIHDWVRKYMGIIKEYVDTLKPELSDVWSLDEMMVNVKGTKPLAKGFYDWVWTIIDPKTKFVLATEVSKRREAGDARKIIAKGKAISKPTYVITDSLHSYETAIRKELNAQKTAHIRTKSLSEGFQNRPIERYHNEIREKLKTRRGLGNDESTQKFNDAYRIYHNFVRPHSGLENNMTPAEAAGIDLNLGHDKIKDLITKSVESKASFAVQLGKRIDKVNISNEKDCIKVSCKGWMEKQTWREINDILRLNGFSWLSNGKDSCWIKLV